MNCEQNTVSLNGFEMDYCCFGNGNTPFVILPGISLMPVTPMAALIAKQYSAFCDDYKVYLFDRKRKIEDGYTMELMSDETAAAMESLGIAGACVMGCSQGGIMAQHIAATHPHLVSKLVLCSTAASVTPTATEALGNWDRLACEGDVQAFNHDVFTRIYSADYYAKNLTAFTYAEKVGNAEDFAHFLPLLRTMNGLDNRSLLKQITCPTLVIGSSIDNVLGPESSPELASLLGCELIMYENYGHALYDEAPAEVQSHILAFFETTQHPFSD